MFSSEKYLCVTFLRWFSIKLKTRRGADIRTGRLKKHLHHLVLHGFVKSNSKHCRLCFCWQPHHSLSLCCQSSSALARPPPALANWCIKRCLMVGILGHSCPVGLDADVTCRRGEHHSHRGANSRNTELLSFLYWSSAAFHVAQGAAGGETAATPQIHKENH